MPKQNSCNGGVIIKPELGHGTQTLIIEEQYRRIAPQDH
jgi:hypothetical protein